MSVIRLAVRRASLTVVDQGVSSVTNLGVSLVAARYLGARAFGVFSAVFLLYVLLIGITRALVSEPLSVRHPSLRGPSDRMAAESAAGTTLVIGGVFVVVLLPLTLALPDELAPVVVALLLTLPGLLLQDTLRFVAFSADRAQAAIRNDTVWLVCVIATVAALVLPGAQRGWTLLAAWGISAHAAALLAAWELRVRPRPGQARSWLRQHGDLGARYVGEFVAVQASGQVTVYIVGMVSGFGELAALRGAQLLFGPYHVFDDAVRRLGIAQLSSLRRRHPSRFPHALRLLSAGMVIAGCAAGLLLLVLPDGVGRGLIGETWTTARTVVVPLALQKMALGAGVGAYCGLRVILAARNGLRVRILSSLVAAAGGYTGAFVGGASGAAIGMAAGQAVGAILYWQAYRSVGSDLQGCSAPAAPCVDGYGPVRTDAVHVTSFTAAVGSRDEVS